MPDGATVRTSKAAVGFRYCNKLFSLEKKCANLQRCIPERIPPEYDFTGSGGVFLLGKYAESRKGSKLAEAVTYAQNQRPALSAFLEHGDVPISNNLA